MPIYEYKCAKCGHGFEYLHRRMNESAPDCPECGASKPGKQFSAFSASVASAAKAACDSCPTSGGCPSAGGGCGGGVCGL